MNKNYINFSFLFWFELCSTFFNFFIFLLTLNSLDIAKRYRSKINPIGRFIYHNVILRNMELIAKISKGSIMDQVYIPKSRIGFSIGDYVIIKPLMIKKFIEKPYLYNIKHLEPIKLDLINQIMGIIDTTVNYENIIITGSFLDQGFNFNDIDILLISEDKLSEIHIKRTIENSIKIKTHLIILNNKTLMRGLSTDPLYQMMLSKCIAKKRFIYRVKYKIDYKLLDLQLLKSKILIDNFDFLNGDEKYYLIKNMIAIFLFLQHKKIDKEQVDKKITKIFDLKDIKEIKQNTLDKDIFLKKYKVIYKKIFNEIMNGVKYDTK